MVVEGIDMEKQEWRGRFKRGDSWRSTAAATCGVCGCQSNKWEMAGYPGMGPRLLCPGNRRYHALHEEISRKRDQVAYNGQFGGATLPRSVIRELEKEIEEGRAKIRKAVKPDVVK